MSPSFMERCQRSADWIRQGGLKEADNISQVEQQSHEWLAKINELGLLTTNSQDGQEDERSYIFGYMPFKYAYKFVNAVNCYSDKICLLILPCDNPKPSMLPVTRWKGEGITNAWLYDDLELHESEKRAYNVPRNIKLGYIVLIDPTWERKAYNKGGLWHDTVDALKRLQAQLDEDSGKLKKKTR